MTARNLEMSSKKADGAFKPDGIESIKTKSVDLFETAGIEKLITEETFAFPSNTVVMLPIMSMFAVGKLIKEPSIEQEEEEELDKDGETIKISKTFITCNNSEITIKAGIEETLFKDDPVFTEGLLVEHFHRTYGIEGLRHFLQLNIFFDEGGRTGSCFWNINKHLAAMGYHKKLNGMFDSALKEKAYSIIKSLASLKFVEIIKKQDQKNNRTLTLTQNLLGIEAEAELTEKKKGQDIPINRTLKIRAHFGYQEAFSGETKQYTKMLKKIVKINHHEKPLAIYIPALLAIYFRMNKTQKFKIKTLMGHCNLDYRTPTEGGDKNKNRHRRLKDMLSQIEYAREQGLIGQYEFSLEGKKIEIKDISKIEEEEIKTEDLFEAVIEFHPPKWFEEKIKQIKDKKQGIIEKNKKRKQKRLPEPQSHQQKPISRDVFKEIFKNSGLSQSQFANILGFSRQAINYIIKGNDPARKNPSEDLSNKIREKFPNYFLSTSP